jgi:acyl-[acyl-carrier-protein] desaturase
VKAIAEEVLTFEMPGAGITGFVRKAAKMADAGIYDLRIHHDDILWPLLRHWRVFELEGLNEVGETARNELSEFLTGLNTQASRFEERREQMLAREAAARV